MRHTFNPFTWLTLERSIYLFSCLPTSSGPSRRPLLGHSYFYTLRNAPILYQRSLFPRFISIPWPVRLLVTVLHLSTIFITAFHLFPGTGNIDVSPFWLVSICVKRGEKERKAGKSAMQQEGDCVEKGRTRIPSHNTATNHDACLASLPAHLPSTLLPFPNDDP